MAGRKPNFKTFLKNYCKYLTGSKDFRMKNFVKNLNENYRAHEPVLLYSLYVGFNVAEKVELSDDLKAKYNSMMHEFNKFNDVESLFENNCNLSYDFQKVYNAYKGEVTGRSADRPVKVRYAKKLKALLEEKKCSKYKVCKNTGVDVGNLHSFLKGAYDRLSFEKCELAYQYLTSLE